MKKEGGGGWPSHLCSVSCHYVLWGSAKALPPRFHSSSSYTRDFKTRTSPRAQREGVASRVWQGRSPLFQTEQSSAPVRGAQSLPQMLQTRCCCPSRDSLIVYSSTQAFQRRLGRKTQHDPHVSWRRRRGETLPVVTATKRKKGTQRKKGSEPFSTCFSDHKMWRSAIAALQKSLGSNYFARIAVLFAKHCFNNVKSTLAPSQC